MWDKKVIELNRSFASSFTAKTSEFCDYEDHNGYYSEDSDNCGEDDYGEESRLHSDYYANSSVLMSENWQKQRGSWGSNSL